MKHDKLEKMRAKIVSAQQEIADIASALVPDNEIELRVRHFVDNQVALVEKWIFNHPEELSMYQTNPGCGPWPIASDAAKKIPQMGFALVVYLNQEAFLRAATDKAKAGAQGRRREASENRLANIEMAKRVLLRLEIEEEAEIERLESIGEDVMRRADADPRVVLGFIDNDSPSLANV